SFGHWTDVGGKAPGSFAPDALEYFEEGIRIPPLKMVDNGVFNRPVLDFLLANMRIPEEREGDLRAQIASSARGRDRLVELFAKYGNEIIGLCMDEIMNYSERVARKIVNGLKKGRYEWAEKIDRESDARPYPKTIRLAVVV